MDQIQISQIELAVSSPVGGDNNTDITQGMLFTIWYFQSQQSNVESNISHISNRAASCPVGIKTTQQTVQAQYDVKIYNIVQTFIQH